MKKIQEKKLLNGIFFSLYLAIIGPIQSFEPQKKTTDYPAPKALKITISFKKLNIDHGSQKN